MLAGLAWISWKPTAKCFLGSQGTRSIRRGLLLERVASSTCWQLLPGRGCLYDKGSAALAVAVGELKRINLLLN